MVFAEGSGEGSGASATEPTTAHTEDAGLIHEEALEESGMMPGPSGVMPGGFDGGNEITTDDQVGTNLFYF